MRDSIVIKFIILNIISIGLFLFCTLLGCPGGGGGEAPGGKGCTSRGLTNEGAPPTTTPRGAHPTTVRFFFFDRSCTDLYSVCLILVLRISV